MGVPVHPLQPGPPGRWRRAALAVCLKEMRETLRDRRTVIAALILPMITMPLIVLAAPILVHRQQQALRARPVRVVVEHDAIRLFVDAGVRAGLVQIRAPADARDALRRAEIDAVLVRQAPVTAAEPPGGRVPEGRPDRVELVRIEVLYDESRPASAEAAKRVADLIVREATTGLEGSPGPAPAGGALLPGGGSPAGPVPGVPTVVLTNVATPERLGGALLASSLPLFLTVWVLLGGQHAALDVGVGERERGTLEALLVLPARRLDVVLGKFIAVLAPSVAALVVALAAGVLSLVLGGRFLAATPVRVALQPGVVAATLAVGVALAGFLSAAQLAVSLAARTLREAQQAFTGLYLVTAMPAMLLPLAGAVLDRPWIAFLPVVNAVWALRELLGGGIGPLPLAFVMGTLVLLTVPLLAASVRQLGVHGQPIRR